MDVTYEEVLNTLKRGTSQEFMDKFAEANSAYVLRSLEEESFAPKILQAHYNVNTSNKQMMQSLDSNESIWFGHVEPNCTAMEMSMKGSQKPKFVTVGKYTARFGKISSEMKQMTQMELENIGTMKSLFDKNDVEQIRVQQDRRFLEMVRAAATQNESVFPSADHYIDISHGLTKEILNIGPKAIIAAELKPAQVLMSSAFASTLSEMDATELGDVSGDLLKDGYTGDKLLKMKMIESYKSDLKDSAGNSLFDKDDATYNYYTLYYFPEPKYLGDFVTYGTDHTHTKWEDDVFEWYAWRNAAMVIANIAGVVQVNLRQAKAVAVS